MHCPYCDTALVNDAAFCPRCGTPVEGAEECTDYQYEAFISYRHLPLDRKAAIKIQRAIENFRIPKQLQGEAGRQKLGKCFRDEDELPTSDSLSDQIENALKHARYLVVVCSPRTRESRWVQREVELYASYHGRSRILIALAEGEPDESFPELMLTLTRKNDAGELEETPAEPLAADFRDLRRSKFDTEKLRIMAPIIGCGFDDLRQRAKQRRNRTIAAIAAGVTAVSVAFGSVSTYQQIQISESYRQIQLEQSEFLANESADLLAHGDRYQATQVALAALPASSQSNDRPFVPAAQMALEQSLGVYPQATNWNSLYSLTNLVSDTTPVYACNSTGLEAIIASDNYFEIREVATGNLITRFDAESLIEADGLSTSINAGLEFSGDNLVAVLRNAVGCFNATDGSLMWKMRLEDLINNDDALAISPDGRLAAVSTEELVSTNQLAIHLIDVQKGTIVRTIELSNLQGATESAPLSRGTQKLAFAPDGMHLYVGKQGTLVDIDLSTGSYTQRTVRYERVKRIDFADGLIIVASEVPNEVDHMPVCLEVFDSSLNLLWSKESALDVVGSDINGKYFHSLGVYGTWDYYWNDSVQLVVLLGDKLLLLDEATGEQVWEQDTNAAFLDCLVTEARGSTRIFAIMNDGTAISRIPYESNSGRGGMVGDTTFDTEFVSAGHLTKTDGRVYCSLWASLPMKRTVYRFATLDDMTEHRPFGTKTMDRLEETGSSDSLTFYCDGKTAVLNAGNVFTFLDVETLEEGTTFVASDLEKLNSDKYYSTAFDTHGNMYFAGKAKTDKDYSSECVIYRVASDGTMDYLFSLDTSLSLDEFYATQNGGKTLLCMVGFINHEKRLIIADPNDESGDFIRASIPIPSIVESWCINDKVILCRAAETSTQGLFSLIDLKTGEEIECDLARYALGSYGFVQSLTTLSFDGSRFIVACSDGVLRAFATTTGALLWETAQTPPIVNRLISGSNDNLLIQDAFGKCMLVSGTTGAVIAASTTTLPSIKSSMYCADTNEVFALFRYGDNLTRTGFVIISLDKDSFGPLSILYNTLIVSPNGKLFVHKDQYSGLYYLMDRLTLDELIAAGNDLVVGHELTESERLLYQIG